MNRKPMKKRFFTLILTLSLCLSIMNNIVPVSAAPETVALDMTIRDFKMDEKLFEGAIESAKGLVRNTLGPNKKPDFSDPNNPSQPLPGWSNWDSDSPVTMAELNALFNDVPDINQKTTKKLVFTKDTEGFYTVKKTGEYMFFPIDGELFGNEEYEHNYHFSMEIHTKFRYQGFECFSFEGNDFSSTVSLLSISVVFMIPRKPLFHYRSLFHKESLTSSLINPLVLIYSIWKGTRQIPTFPLPPTLTCPVLNIVKQVLGLFLSLIKQRNTVS